MEHIKNLARAALGVGLIVLAVILFFEVMNLRHFPKRFGNPDAITLLAVSFLSGLVSPPLITGLHKLFVHAKANPVWNREAHRFVAGAMAAGLLADFIAAYAYGRSISLGYNLMTILVGTPCLYMIRKSPSGITPRPQGTQT